MRLATTLTAVVLLLALRPAAAQPVVDGSCGDAAYTELAAATSGANGFGDNSDLGGLYHYADGTDLYVCIAGEVDAATDHNVLLFLDFTGYGGLPAGTPLPTAANTALFQNIDGTTLDLEADYAFAGNIYEGTFFVDAARYGSSAVVADGFVGGVSPDGTAGTFDPTGVTGGTGSMAVAYQAGFADDAKGLEYRFPVAAFAGVDAMQDVSFFVAIASQGGYWSNELLPDLGLVGTADAGENFGFDPDLQAASGAQDLFTAPQPLPVELTAFDAVADGRDVVLTWTTASEQGSALFAVEQAAGGGYRTVATVEAAGTTAAPQRYRHRVRGLAAGTYRFRLRQVDVDGTTVYGPAVEVAVELAGRYELAPAAPNPFNPSTQFTLTVRQAQRVQVAVYDLLGRRVALLHDGPLAADAAHAFRFDAAGLPSGLYVVRAAGERFTAAQTVTLLK